MGKILTIGDMETPRSPKTLALWYYSKYEEIRGNRIELEKARLKQGVYHYFVPEIYPLVLFSLWKYPNEDVICVPKIGNQGYDATIYVKDDPTKFQTVEVTWPQDGRERQDIARILNDRGFHCRVGDDFENYNRDVAERVIAAARKKSRIDYHSPGGSALLIVINTECSPLYSAERDAEIGSIIQEIQKLSYLVDAVYLIATPHEGIYPVIENPEET